MSMAELARQKIQRPARNSTATQTCLDVDQVRSPSSARRRERSERDWEDFEGARLLSEPFERPPAEWKDSSGSPISRSSPRERRDGQPVERAVLRPLFLIWARGARLCSSPSRHLSLSPCGY